MKNFTVGLVVFGLLICSLSGNAFADTLVNTPVLTPQTLQIKMPDGSIQTGFIKDGVFIPVNPNPQLESTAAPSPIIQGAIKTQVPQIDITCATVPLNSRLKHQYTGYTITVSNASKESLELMNGEIVNGVNGQGAALGAQKSSAAAIGTVLGAGLVTGFFTLGISTLASWVASPIIYGANSHQNNKAIAEGTAYSNQVRSGVFNTGDSFKIATLVPISQKPEIKLTFRKVSNGELFSISK